MRFEIRALYCLAAFGFLYTNMTLLVADERPNTFDATSEALKHITEMKVGVHDWPNQGICCAPMIEGDRLWYVTSRGEVVCLDTEGYIDGENDGPFKDEANDNKDEADVPLIVDGKVYIGDEDGDISVFKLSSAKELIAEINQGSAVYTTPIVANDVLYIANQNPLYAMQEDAASKPANE